MQGFYIERVARGILDSFNKKAFVAAEGGAAPQAGGTTASVDADGDTRMTAEGSTEARGRLQIPKLRRERSFVGVEYWVTTYTRPGTIRMDFVDKIRAVGAQHVPPELRAELIQWATLVRSSIEDTPAEQLGQTRSLCSEHGTPQVTKLALVLSQLLAVLGAKESHHGGDGAGGGAGWFGSLRRMFS